MKVYEQILNDAHKVEGKKGIRLHPSLFHKMMMEIHDTDENRYVETHAKEGYNTLMGIPIDITTKVETWEIVSLEG